MFYWFVHTLFNIIRPLFFPLQVKGREHIPLSGGFVLASNHISYMDPVVIALSQNRRISFVAKDSLFKGKVLGWILRHLDAFPIKRESADIGAIRETIRRLKQGRGVLIFPEGTRIRDFNDREIQSGIGMITLKSAVPVVPVYVKGTEKILPSGAKFLKRHQVTVQFGKPFCFSPQESYEDVAREIMRNVDALS